MKNNNYKLCPGMLFLSTLLVLLSLSACNSGLGETPRQPTPAPQSVGSVDAASYFPLIDGNGWVYQATASGGAAAPARYVNHVRLANHSSAGGTASLLASESTPAPAAPAAYHLQSTAQGIRRFDETNQGGVLPALSEPYLEIPFPLNFGSTLRQIDKTDVDSGRDVDGDGVNDSVDIVADVTVLGNGSVSVPAGEFAECIVIQQRIAYTMHATKTGAAVVTHVRRTQWLVKDIGAVRRETVVDGSTVVEELITTNRTLATGSGDVGLSNPAVASAAGEIYLAWTGGDLAAGNRFARGSGAPSIFRVAFDSALPLSTNGDFSLAAGSGRAHFVMNDGTQPTAVYTAIGGAGRGPLSQLWAETAPVSQARIAVNESGRAYIAGSYLSRSGGVDMQTLGLFTVDERNGGLDGPLVLASTSYDDRNASPPAIATAGNHVYVVWKDSALAVLASHDGGRSFAVGVRLAARAARAGDRAVATDGDGDVYVVTNEGSDRANLMLYKSSDFGATFAAVHLPTSDDAVPVTGAPQIVLLGDEVHVAFLGDQGSGTNLFILRSLNGGRTFEPPLNISGVAAGEYVHQFSLASDGQDKVYLAWTANRPTVTAVETRLVMTQLPAR